MNGQAEEIWNVSVILTKWNGINRIIVSPRYNKCITIAVVKMVRNDFKEKIKAVAPLSLWVTITVRSS